MLIEEASATLQNETKEVEALTSNLKDLSNQTKKASKSNIEFINTLNDLAESFKKLQPAFNYLLKDLNKTGDHFASLFKKISNSKMGLIFKNITSTIGNTINDLSSVPSSFIGSLSKVAVYSGKKLSFIAKSFKSVFSGIFSGLAQFASKGLSFLTSHLEQFKAAIEIVVQAFQFVDKVAKKFNIAKDFATDINSSIASVMRLEHVAEAMGVSSDKLQEGIKQLGSSSKESLAELGLEIDPGKFSNQLDLFKAFSKEISQLSHQEQLNIMNKLDLDPSLLKMMGTEADELGSKFDSLSKRAGLNYDDIANKSSTFSSKFGELQTVFTIIGESFGSNLLDPFSDGMAMIIQIVEDNMPTIADIFGVIGKAAGVLVKIIGTAARIFINAFCMIWDVVSPIINLLIDWLDLLSTAASLMANFLIDAIMLIWEPIRDFFAWITSKITGPIKWLINKLFGGFDDSEAANQNVANLNEEATIQRDTYLKTESQIKRPSINTESLNQSALRPSAANQSMSSMSASALNQNSSVVNSNNTFNISVNAACDKEKIALACANRCRALLDCRNMPGVCT